MYICVCERSDDLSSLLMGIENNSALGKQFHLVYYPKQ
jgi:hypothetical protein